MKHIHDALKPLVGTPFVIHEDGTSQTKLTNKGRFGNYVEGLFGISPNKDPGPDTSWAEIKTARSDYFKDCSIGNLREVDYQAIKAGQQALWKDSFVYSKINSTLFVFYSSDSGYNPEYTINGYKLVKIREDNPTFQNDWSKIVTRIKESYSYNDIDFTGLNTSYLSMQIKGNKNGLYPNMKFKASFIRYIHSLN